VTVSVLVQAPFEFEVSHRNEREEGSEEVVAEAARGAATATIRSTALPLAHHLSIVCLSNPPLSLDLYWACESIYLSIYLSIRRSN